MSVEYRFTKDRTEVIYSIDDGVTSNDFILGYQLFNLISWGIDDILKMFEESKSIPIENIKNHFDMAGIDKKTDDFEDFFIPELSRKEDSELGVKKSILFIQHFFKVFTLESITLEVFLNFLTEFNLRVPCHSEGRLTEDYSNVDFEVESFSEFSEHLNSIVGTWNYNIDCALIYYCDSFIDVLIACVHYILSNNYSIKRCKVCELLYVPSRSDTLYCDRISPYKEKMTCKDYGAYQASQEKLKNSEPAKLCRNLYQKKQMRAKRNPTLPKYKEDFKNFKNDVNQWKYDLLSGKVTDDEYLAWLKEVENTKI